MATSIVAKEALDKGEFKEAASLYDRAFKHDPTEPGYLYSAARCKHKAKMWGAAADDYAAVLKFKSLHAKMADKARAYLLEVRSAKAAQLVQELEKKKQDMARAAKENAKQEAVARQRAQQDAERAAAKRPTAAPVTSSVMPWILTGGGAVAAIGGIVFFAAAQGQSADLREVLPGEGDGSISYEAAVDEKNDIEFKRYVGGGLLAAGAIGAGVGVWMMMKPSAEATSKAPLLMPAFGGRGAVVRLSF